MNTFLELLAESLGWTLLHFCWQAAAIALVYGILDLGLSGARSQTRYLVSLAAILSMFAVSLGTLGYEIQRNRIAYLAGNQPAQAVPSSFAHLTPLESLAALTPVATDLPQANASRQAALDLSPVLPWIDAAWLLGVLCLSARTVGGCWWIRRLRRSALAEAPASVLAGLARVRQRLGVRRRVNLRISRHISGPIAIGLLRPLILLPASALLALSPEQMEVLLAHELAHVRRADYFWNLVQTLIETLFFFHPAVWWAGKRLREQRELCCDDIAVDSYPDPLLYATALLSMEEQRRRQPELAMAFDGHQPWSRLRLRIARVLGEESPQSGRRALMPLPMAALCAALVVLLLPAVQVFGSLGSSLGHNLRFKAAASAAQAQPSPAPLPAPKAATARPQPHVAGHEQNAPRPRKAKPEDLELPGPARPQIKSPELMSPLPLRIPVIHLHPVPPPHFPPNFSVSAIVPLRALPGLTAYSMDGAQAAGAAKPAAPASPTPPSPDYIEQMRAAGYDLPAEKYFDFKVLGVTPEYARAMQQARLGKPSLGNLMAMKALGVTPEYLARLRAAGVQVHSFQDVIEYKSFNLSPEDIAKLKAAGFGPLDPHEIILLRSQGVTPEYAAEMRKQFPNLTVGQLVQLRIFKIDAAFIAEAKRHNFAPLTVEKLVRLRISGLLDDGVNDPKQ